MKAIRLIAVALLCAAVLTGCGKNKDTEDIESFGPIFTYNEKFSGTVVDRYSKDEREYLMLSVLGGEEIEVTIGKDCAISGSKRLWIGDYVELECASSTADDARSATSIKIESKGSISGLVTTYTITGNRMFIVTAPSGESYGFIISEHTALNWNAPVPGGGEGQEYVISWNDFGASLSVTVDADKAVAGPTSDELPSVMEWFSAKRVTVTDIPSGWFERPA